MQVGYTAAVQQIWQKYTFSYACAYCNWIIRVLEIILHEFICWGEWYHVILSVYAYRTQKYT